MNKIKNFSLSKLFSNRRFTAIFSIVVAFIAWLAVTVNETETRTSTFANITINMGIEDSFAGSMGLEIVSEEYIKTANVTVEGPNYIVSALKPNDLLINADLSAVTAPGEYNIPLVAQATNGARGFTIIEVSPSAVKLTFDYVDTKEFDVTSKADDITAKAGLIKDTPVLNYVGDSKKLAVTGARNDINRIDRVEAIVSDKGELDASQTYDAKIVIYDKDGKELDTSLFKLPYDEFKVTVPIYKKKTVPVVPVFSGEPSVGAGLSKVSKISPSSVTVMGAPEVIDALTSVELQPIEYSAITNGKVFQVGLNLPGGVKEMSTPIAVKVTMKR